MTWRSAQAYSQDPRERVLAAVDGGSWRHLILGTRSNANNSAGSGERWQREAGNHTYS